MAFDGHPKGGPNAFGGDPRRRSSPKGNARRTFDRLAEWHAHYVARITAHGQERLRWKLSNRPGPLIPPNCGLRARHASYQVSRDETAPPAMPKIEVCFPIGGAALAGAAKSAWHSAPTQRER